LRVIEERQLHRVVDAERLGENLSRGRRSRCVIGALAGKLGLGTNAFVRKRLDGIETAIR
jgi:hypothetical protein